MKSSESHPANRDESREPVAIRVTGGIGSGKSTLCDALAARGAMLFNADQVAKNLMHTDQDLRKKIQQRFGKDSYHSDGTLNRQYLAERVFADELELAALNGIVHPAVFQSFAEVRGEAAAAGVRYLVYEAALLTDSPDRDSLFDLTVVVDSSAVDRIARVQHRDGIDSDRVVARIQKQPSRQAYLEAADYVVVNDGTQSDLTKKASSLLDSIEANVLPTQSTI